MQFGSHLSVLGKGLVQQGFAILRKIIVKFGNRELKKPERGEEAEEMLIPEARKYQKYPRLII